MENFATPPTAEDFIISGKRFKGGTLRAMRMLARTKPWRGSFDKRWADFAAAFTALQAEYGLDGWALQHVGSRWGDSGQSKLNVQPPASEGQPPVLEIHLSGRPSVVTLLQMVHKARQVQRCIDQGQRLRVSHDKAVRWSLTLFKRKFPVSYARCTLDPRTGLLINEGLNDRERAVASAVCDDEFDLPAADA